MNTETLIDTCRIYQVYYDQWTKQSLDPQFRPYYNSKSSIYFEFDVMADLYNGGAMNHCQYFGVVSWRIWEKVARRPSMAAFIEKDGMKHDFYYASWWWGPDAQPWRQTEQWLECDLTSWTERLMAELGYTIDLTSFPIPPSFYNYHVCRTELYREFMMNFALPMKRLLDDTSRPELQEWLYQEVPYRRALRVTGPVGRFLQPIVQLVPLESRRRMLKVIQASVYRWPGLNPNAVPAIHLAEMTGVPYYTRHAFIMEGLFPTYAALRGWTGKQYG